MPIAKREILSGWGYYPAAECLCWRPEKHRDLQSILSGHGPVLARGMGRSYGDAAMQPNGIILTTRLDHYIEFDTVQGTVRAQAGVTLAELMDLAIPRGWFPPVIPGTRHVTLGGAFACNVHGKNHWRDGDFAEHVLSIQLMLAEGDIIECSPHEHSELFWATAGGMGMTGIIEQVTLQLKPVASASLNAITFRVGAIGGMIEAFEQYRDRSDYMVGWIDHMARHNAIGRGIFEAASHMTTADGGAPLKNFTPQKTAFSVPLFAPQWCLNRYSMAFYNAWRFKKYSETPQTEKIGFDGFFHPLDRIGQWNRLYGRRGFFQYQCLIPETPDIASRLHAFLEFIHRRKCFSFLGVIKYHRDGVGMLTFSKRGYSIALDFPNTGSVRALIPHLDRWVAEQDGRVYLAKDALLSSELFHAMYGNAADDWCDMIRDIDTESKFTSMMSQRLKWKPSVSSSRAEDSRSKEYANAST